MLLQTAIDKSASDTIKLSNQISMIKDIVLPEKHIETTIIAFRFDDKSGQVSTSTCIWQQFGYFNQQLSDFNMTKKNYPENSIIYMETTLSLVRS